MVQGGSGKAAPSKATPIEKVKSGDWILAAREDGTVTEQPVIFATDHQPTVADLVQITLQSGKQITATDHHMMVVRDNGQFKLKLAALVESGDVFCSKNVANDVVED